MSTTVVGKKFYKNDSNLEITQSIVVYDKSFQTRLPADVRHMRLRSPELCMQLRIESFLKRAEYQLLYEYVIFKCNNISQVTFVERYCVAQGC